MTQKSKFLFQWRKALMSTSGGAPCKGTRSVLLALSLHMDTSGGSCFPSTQRLADECLMSRKTVEKYLTKAVDAGWLERSERGTGQGWRRYDYQARLPPTPRDPPTPPSNDKGGPSGGRGGSAGRGKAGQPLPTRKSENSPGGRPTTSFKPLSHPLPSQANPVRDVWQRVRSTILQEWHGGAERIEVNGENIGMGKERAILGDLLDALPAETVEAAILASPSLPGWQTPTSLRWLTSREHGGANIERALGKYHKQARPVVPAQARDPVAAAGLRKALFSLPGAPSNPDARRPDGLTKRACGSVSGTVRSEYQRLRGLPPAWAAGGRPK